MRESNEHWISEREASRLSKRNPYSVARLALVGKIRILVEPGRALRYSREDVANLSSDDRGVAVAGQAGV